MNPILKKEQVDRPSSRSAATTDDILEILYSPDPVPITGISFLDNIPPPPMKENGLYSWKFHSLHPTIYKYLILMSTTFLASNTQ